MNQNQFITRQQTVIVAANERESYAQSESAASRVGVVPTNGYFEVILNKPVIVKSGDVISVKSCYIDTTEIDVQKITIAEDTTVSWNSGMYVRNQQLVTFFANKVVHGPGQLLTDNKPYPLCYIQPVTNQTEGGVLHYKTATARSWEVQTGAFGETWGGLQFLIQYKDPNGMMGRFAAFIPSQPKTPPYTGVAAIYDINFVGMSQDVYEPRAIDPTNGNVLDPGGQFPAHTKNYKFVRVPITNPQGVGLTEPHAIPVINTGSFLLPAGQYEPVHLAKVLTDGLSTLPLSGDSKSVIQATSPFYLDLQVVIPVNYPTGAGVEDWEIGTPPLPNNFTDEFCVIKIDQFIRLTYPYIVGVGGPGITSTGGPSQDYTGWTLTVNYYWLDGVNAKVAQCTRTILSVGMLDEASVPPIFYPNRMVFGSIPEPGKSAVAQPLSPVPIELGAAHYKQPTIILTPPFGEADGGSTFIQSSLNYTQTSWETGSNLYCFCDASQETTEANQLLTFDITPNHPQIFGTNEMAIIYDTDKKRFKFDQTHYAATNGVTGTSSGTTPAIIKQVRTVIGSYFAIDIAGSDVPYYYPTREYAEVDVTPTGPGGAPTDARNSNCINMITPSIGGVYFTDLQPHSLWSNIMGFDLTGPNSILTSVGRNSFTAQSYAGYTQVPADHSPANLTNPQAPGQIFGSAPVVDFDTVTLPYVPLVVGQHITAQSISIGDATGVLLDYTGGTEFSTTAGPTLGPDGRISVQDDALTSIEAGNLGDQIGVQDSGYYIIDVEVGLQYNEFIGSDTNQQGFTRNIRMIVDRYYSANSYVSSEGDGVEYIHYGNDMVINSVKVRIYNANGREIDRLGNDNSVFLRIMKTVNINLAPLLEAQAEQQKQLAKETNRTV